MEGSLDRMEASRCCSDFVTGLDEENTGFAVKWQCLEMFAWSEGNVGLCHRQLVTEHLVSEFGELGVPVMDLEEQRFYSLWWGLLIPSSRCPSDCSCFASLSHNVSKMKKEEKRGMILRV